MFDLAHPYQKINSTFKDNAEDLDIIIPMYNLLEYSDNCFMTVLWGSLCNYYGDEVDNVSDNTSDGKSFNHKTKITIKEEVKPA